MLYWTWPTREAFFLLNTHQCPRRVFREPPRDVLACFFEWVPAVNSWHLSTIDYELCWQRTLTVQSSGDRSAGFNNYPPLRVSFSLSEVCKAFSLFLSLSGALLALMFTKSITAASLLLKCSSGLGVCVFKAAEQLWSLRAMKASSLLAT